jgi:glutamyl-Q tRNA(Asp) synthetase
LLDSTSRQICLQKALGYPAPDYVHLPVAMSADGRKLGKRFQTDPVANKPPARSLELALLFLGQQPPANCSLDRLWNWALENWNSNLVPRKREIFPVREHSYFDWV